MKRESGERKEGYIVVREDSYKQTYISVCRTLHTNTTLLIVTKPLPSLMPFD